MAESSRSPGLFASARGLLATLLALLHNRLQLLGVELAEEKLRLLAILGYGAVAVIGLSAGTVFLAIFVTVLFWDEHRLLLLGLFSAFFLGGGYFALRVARRNARAGSRLFADSLAELRKDADGLAADTPPQP